MTTEFPGFDRITADPDVLGGVPCVRGTRLSVRRVLEILSLNPSWDELRADFSALEEEDVRQVLAFAAAQLTDRYVPLAAS